MLQQQKTLYFEYTNLGQKRLHVRIGALAPISSEHGLYLLFASYVDWISDSNKGLVANTSRIFPWIGRLSSFEALLLLSLLALTVDSLFSPLGGLSISSTLERGLLK